MAVLDKKTLAAAKKYTDQEVAGGGAIKGKNCTIDSIDPITGGNRVTFKWTLDNGTVQTGTMDVMDGADGQDGQQGPQGIQGPAGPAGADGADGQDGLGIKSVDINENNHLIITYDDDTTHDAGEIPGGGTGEVTSVNGKNGVVILYATDIKMSNDPSAQTIKLTIDQLAGSLANKVNKEAGKGLSANDFSDTDKDKLDNLADIKSIGAGLSLDPNTGELEATGIAIEIDDHLDKTSAHAIQNQAVAIPFEALQASLLDLKSKLPTKTSDLTNDSDFVSDDNYIHTDNNYSGSDKTAVQQTIPLQISQLQGSLLTKAPQATTYTKTEVDTLLAAIKNGRFEVVVTLPTTDIKTNVIYLVPKSSAASQNVYDEYVNLDGTTAGWEKIGDTEIDLSNYIQKNSTSGLVKNDGTIDTNTYLTQHQDISGKADKVVSAVNGNFASLDANGNLQDSGKKASDFVTDISGKADKVSGAVANNFAGLDANGNLKDSGKKASDFAAANDLDSWVGPSYADSNGDVTFDNLDDTQAYKLIGKDMLVRINGQPTKTTGTTSGTVKVTFSTDAPNNTECWLRKMKK